MLCWVKATGVNPVTPWRLSVTQESLLFSSVFLIFHSSAPVFVRGCCPGGLKPLPLVAVPRGSCSCPHLAATLVLGGVCELGSSPHQQTKRCKKRAMISQPAAARPGAKDWAEAAERGWISPATAQLHPGIVPS